jgi:hypothetical protein
VCLLGHSFIRRLDDFMDNSYNYYNLSLPESKFNIISRAKGGLTIRRLINERPELFDFGNIRISIVYIYNLAVTTSVDNRLRKRPRT